MLNHITIMGRLTRDPELRYTQSQTPVASFTLAVDRDYGSKDDGGKQTDFVDCVAWRQTAEFVSKYFQKGSMAVVAGRLQSRRWQDREGNNRVNWEILASNIYFGESKRENSGQYQSPYQSPTAPSYSSNTQVPYQSTQRYSPDSAPGTAYQQSTFTELDDSDGDLPF